MRSYQTYRDLSNQENRSHAWRNAHHIITMMDLSPKVISMPTSCMACCFISREGSASSKGIFNHELELDTTSMDNCRFIPRLRETTDKSDFDNIFQHYIRFTPCDLRINIHTARSCTSLESITSTHHGDMIPPVQFASLFESSSLTNKANCRVCVLCCP